MTTLLMHSHLRDHEFEPPEFHHTKIECSQCGEVFSLLNPDWQARVKNSVCFGKPRYMRYRELKTIDGREFSIPIGES